MLLHIPMVGQVYLSAIFNPNSPLIIHESSFPSLRPVLNGVLSDDGFSLAVLDQLRLEGILPTGRQPGLSDLVNHLPRQIRAQNERSSSTETRFLNSAASAAAIPMTSKLGQ